MAFEVGTLAQWIAGVVRPLVGEVQVANPSLIPWLFRVARITMLGSHVPRDASQT